MSTILFLILVQIVFVVIAVVVLRNFWNQELVRAAIEKLEALPSSTSITEIAVRSSSLMKEEYKNRIESIRQRKFAQAQLNIQEDPSLKGGMVITLGDQSLDFSL